MYRREDLGFGQADGASAGGAIALDAPIFGRAAAPAPGPGWSSRLRAFDLAVDLGADIGSARWYRGLGTLGAMLAALLHFAPGPIPLPRIGSSALAPSEQDEVRAIGVAPQAFGADSGRRIVATDRAIPLTSAPERPRIDAVATLGPGDGFVRLLEREGVSAADAAIAADLVSRAIPVEDIAAGTRIAFTLGRRPRRGVERPLDALSLRARLDLALSLRRDGGRLVLDRQPIAVDDTPLRITGLVGGGLYRAARMAGVPATLVADYLRAIGPHIDIDAIGSDDRFDLVMAHRRAATGESETGRLLYAGLQHGNEHLQLLRWTLAGGGAGGEQWFDADGVGAKRSGFTMPVAGAHITSGFGMRFHPILGFSRMHQGVDLAVAYGTPIVAASDGVVRFAGWHGGHGNFVQIAHAGGMGTGYGHMSRYVVSPGESVQQGQLIGYVGTTGLSTGPHLHFEVYRGGVPVDPAGASFAATSQIAGADLARFRAALARLTSLIAGGAEPMAAAVR